MVYMEKCGFLSYSDLHEIIKKVDNLKLAHKSIITCKHTLVIFWYFRLYFRTYSSAPNLRMQLLAGNILLTNQTNAIINYEQNFTL